MLENLKVIELASVLAGPDVGMFFAELGSDVVKIENKLTNGDVTRKWKQPPESKEHNLSAYFSAANYNKTYVFLDLTIAEDLKKVYELIESADVLIANFKPGDAKKLKLDYPTIKAINPNIIYGEINGYGKDSNRVAFDVVLQAETGFMSINGTPENGAVKMPVAFIDVFAAHQLKEGILVALLERQKTNKGCHVEVSLYDAAISSLKNQATNWLMNNIIPKRLGSLHPNIAPYGETFITKDNLEIVLGIGNDKQFKKLAHILNCVNLLYNENYNTNQKRVINRTDLYEELSQAFKNYNSIELMEKFLIENVPAGIIKTIDKVFEDESAKDLILEEEIDGISTKRVKTAVFKISS